MNPTPHNDDDVDPALDATLQAFESPLPADGFPDRVLRAQAAARARSVRTTAATMAAMGSAAALLLLGVLRPWEPGNAATGNVSAHGTQEAALGNRATVTTLGGGELDWEVAPDGAATVQQRRGRVFYRVERGGAFVVHAGLASVTVQGTSFEVEILNHGATMLTNTQGAGKAAAVGVAVGAALSAAVLVTVYEGRVALASERGSMVLTAGQSAVAAGGDAPRQVPGRVSALEADQARLRRERDGLQEEVAGLEEQLRRVTLVSRSSTTPMQQELETLRQELKQLRQTRALEREEQASKAGTTTPWPEGLPERYRQDGLRSALTQSLQAAGINGEVRSMDCTEFPCIAFGQINHSGSKEEAEAEYKKFDVAIREQFPDDSHSVHESAWSNTRRGPDGKPRTVTHFGISIYPDNVVDKDTQASVRKRSRFRTQSYMDTELE